METVSENGSVNRGIMFGENNYLTRIVECNVTCDKGKWLATPLNGESTFLIDDTTKATMVTYGFDTNIFTVLQEEFIEFLNTNKNNLDKCEFYITSVIQKQIDNQTKKVLMINTNAKWHGITYKEDVEALRMAIQKYHDEKEYPTPLW